MLQSCSLFKPFYVQAFTHAEFNTQKGASVWVNSISLFGDFVPPLLLSFFVIQWGYSSAWLYLALVASALMLPLFLSRASK
jgi:hypothetical protein